MRMSLAMCGLVVATALGHAQAGDAALPSALAELVEAERQFAAAARAKGVRDAFLAFFEDGAMFRPGAGLAKDQLRKSPAEPFSVRELTWEPRTGDVAASGELGWLTGPGRFVNRAAKDPTPRHTNYLSIWRRQPDGRWLVFIDLGTRLQEPATFAPGFVRFPFVQKYSGGDGKAAAEASLSAADGGFNERIGVSPAAAFAETLAPAARVHRNGIGAMTEPGAVAKWLDEHAQGVRAESQFSQAAASGELGYTYGSWQAPGGQRNTYLRVWTRTAAGRWRVVVDVLAED